MSDKHLLYLKSLSNKKKSIVTLIILFFSLIGMILLYRIFQSHPSSLFAKQEVYINKPLMKLITTLVEKEYVDTPDLDKMKEGALSGMLLALDPYSTYINEENYKHFMDTTNGEFGGIGLEILYTDAGLRVISPLDDTPAAKAGIQAGDIITHLDNEPISGKGYGQILQIIHGKPGTTLNVTLTRGDQNPLKLALTREVITINPVKISLQNNILYIRLSYFNDKAAGILKEKLLQYDKEKTNNDIKGIILDLRNNPGGILEQAIDISSLFLGNQDIVHVQSRETSKNKTYKGTEKALLPTIPMVTLINGGSASASEIVAAALQDHKRSLLLGTRSHGKGSVQTLFPLQHLGAIRLTTAKFLSPLQKPIQDKGVTPDMIVDSYDFPLGFKDAFPSKIDQKNRIPSENDPQLQRAMDILHGFELLKNLNSPSSISYWRS